jgi:hypothetical protein
MRHPHPRRRPGSAELLKLNPFALSLSKPVLSDAAGGVEGGCPFSLPAFEEEEQRFDKLSPNGMDLRVRGTL